MAKYTKRAAGSRCADNLFMAAGSGPGRIERLAKTLNDWMEDHHPAMRRSVHRRVRAGSAATLVQVARGAQDVVLADG